MSSFYDDVMRELVVALGAALFFANAFALLRRRRDATARSGGSGARSAKAKGSSRVSTTGRTREGELVQAPVTRTVAFAVLGFVMMVAGLAAILTQ